MPFFESSLGAIMKQAYLKSLSADELWLLHEKITTMLAAKLAADNEMLEKRLRQLRELASRQSRRLCADPTQPFFRNSETQTNRLKHGPVVGSSRAG